MNEKDLIKWLKEAWELGDAYGTAENGVLTEAKLQQEAFIEEKVKQFQSKLKPN